MTFATVNGHDHVIDHTLNELEARLEARRFVRIHRATLVNIAFVQELFPAVDALRPFGGLRVRLERGREATGSGRPERESKGGGVIVRLKDE